MKTTDDIMLQSKLQTQPPEIFYKKGVLKISQNSQETPASDSLLKKRLRLMYFLLSFAKFLKAPFIQNISGRLPVRLNEIINIT